jgi:6-phosphogluconolactonase/glucosamine-6-phosphate isomerase/deaminase
MIRIFADYEALSRAAASHVVLAGKRCAAERGRFDWVLAGGATPRTTYKAVAELTQKVPGFW